MMKARYKFETAFVSWMMMPSHIFCRRAAWERTLFPWLHPLNNSGVQFFHVLREFRIGFKCFMQLPIRLLEMLRILDARIIHTFLELCLKSNRIIGTIS